MGRSRRGHPRNPISSRLSGCTQSRPAGSCARSFTLAWCAAASAEEPDCSDLAPAKTVADRPGLPSCRNNREVGTIGDLVVADGRRRRFRTRGTTLLRRCPNAGPERCRAAYRHYAARAGRTSPSPGRASRRTVFPDEGAPAIRRLGGHRVVLSGGTGTSGHCACDLRAWLRHGWHRGVLIGPSCVATAGPKARVLGRRCGSLLVRRLRFSWGRFATGRSHPVACHFAEEKEVIVPT
jgi:hypothetical protein